MDLEALKAIMEEMEEMRDFALQLNASLAEMESEIYLAAVQILSAEKDINAFKEVIQVREEMRSSNGKRKYDH